MYHTSLCFRQCVLSNFLTTLLRPNFAKPIETVEDLVNSDTLLYEQYGGEYWQQQYASSPKESYQKMATMMIFAKSDDDFDNLTVQMAKEGGLAQIAAVISPYELEWGMKHHPQGRGFWESKEKISERNILHKLKVITNLHDNIEYVKKCL